MKKYPWKTVWVIGGSTGLGAATIRILDYKDIKTYVSARSAENLNKLCKNCKSAEAIPLDITNRKDVTLTVNNMVTRLGKLPELIILNAAIYTPMNSDSFNASEIANIMQTNYLGNVNVIESLLKYKDTKEKITIAIVTSPSGWRGLPNSAGYGPSKAALINLVEGLKAELYHSDFDLRLINPGFIKTQLTDKNDFKMPQLMEPEYAAKEMLSGLCTNKFDITFPNPFLFSLKILRILPYKIYFWLMKKIDKKRAQKGL